MPTAESVKDTFCPIPWIHTSMDSIGNLRICCLANLEPFGYFRREDQTRYNAEVDLVPRNHDYSKFVRSEMLKGNKPDACLLSPNIVYTHQVYYLFAFLIA